MLALVAGIATIIVLVLRTRLDAFIALLVACVVTGILAGQELTGIVGSITTGFGTTLGNIGIVIGLGVAIGKILEVSGAADALARAFLKAFGRGREEWALGSVGSLVSIPVFCDSGYVIMNPLARSIARVKRGGYVALALALGCGMTLTHHMVPPTPGPLAATGILGADLGLVIVTGLVFTVILLPVVVVYARWIGPTLEDKIVPEVREAVYPHLAAVGSDRSGGGAGTRSGSGGDGPVADGDRSASDPDPQGEVQTYDPETYFGEPPAGEEHRRVGALLGSLPLAIPLALIVANTVTAAIDRNQQGALAGDYEASGWTAPFAFILLITGAGGAFGQVLRDSGVGDALAEAIASTALPAFLVPFVIATVVRIAQGSGTVAMITAASVTAPLVDTLGVDPVVAVLACTAGSMVFSYFNDSYFWVVTRFTGLEGTAALKGWSGITTAVWVGSIPLLFVLNLIMG
ncbi:gluconate permease [Serinicoccus chungangensis]|uniref:Gluconate permease n=1 Tax=Serinicoccus chungangensis TaxID=767452 RepID=A0A0W8IC23_9MICO|nr:gluconate permease [Serinicoccus chungangensis]